MRISYWSSDVCSSVLRTQHAHHELARRLPGADAHGIDLPIAGTKRHAGVEALRRAQPRIGAIAAQFDRSENRRIISVAAQAVPRPRRRLRRILRGGQRRSEEHTSELQSLMRISYAVFCLKKKTHITNNTDRHENT